jgi:HEAT repeat protein
LDVGRFVRAQDARHRKTVAGTGMPAHIARGVLYRHMEEEFGRTLERLQEAGPQRADLLELSNLHGKMLDQLAEAWPSFPLERRQGIIARLIEIAEADFEADFCEVFRIGLADEDPQVRASSIEGLWEVDEVTLIRPLVRALSEDPAEIVREAAATSLGRFALRAEMDQLQPRLSTMVWEALWNTVRDEGDDLHVRRRALESLAYFDRPEVREAIGRAYEHEDDAMRISAVFAMGRSADEEWSGIVMDELSSMDPAMRYEAARACGELQIAGAVARLSRMTADTDLEVKLAAVWALGQIGGPESRRVLDICAEMGDDALRAAARSALDELDYVEENIDLSLYDLDLEAEAGDDLLDEDDALDEGELDDWLGEDPFS